jgi:hypothetical protein
LRTRRVRRGGGPEILADDLAVIFEGAGQRVGSWPGGPAAQGRALAGQILDAAVSVTAHPPETATRPMPR